MEKDQQLFEAYRLSRHRVQLLDVSLQEVQAKKVKDDHSSADAKFRLGLSKKIEVVDEKTSYGFLKADVEVVEKETGEISLSYSVVFKGKFKSNKSEDENFMREFTDLQIVPQLLPYVRSTISTIAGMMSTFSNPVLVPLVPTMDIVQTIRLNQNADQSEDQDNDEKESGGAKE